MQRTLALTGVALMLAVAAGLAVVTDKAPRSRWLGALWNGTTRRARALMGRPQRSPEHSADAATW